ncbi:unnamed protein product [Prorocentrum cordatum]|uniref:Non-specific serine/threonine protein kinase n=1 Tax=Prorocentrum cordatum TaxID=2364126 RepID=A0ABN9VJ37_9DINO|nr:unnamed protein product [Polarella glacialis]
MPLPSRLERRRPRSPAGRGQSVVYRSLKPEDILLDADGYCKLIDFGFAKELPEGDKTFTLCGTPEYLAPEVILNQGHGRAADWYSLGVLAYEMTVGKPPFQGKDANEVYQNILTGRIKFPATADTGMKSLVKGLLQSNPETRAGGRGGAEGVRSAAWFRGLSWEDLLARRLPAPFRPPLRGADDTSRYPKQEEPDGGAAGGELDPRADVFRRLW